ncbi:MAG: hypothetical protein INR69_06470 [Mucilaginibacter polytrichastri]|nr:hypothetical protein [Mucilaginibacter polytrichastri]
MEKKAAKKDIHASYINTFIRVSNDCPVTASEIPPVKDDRITGPAAQYQLLAANPYTYDHKELTWRGFLLQKGFEHLSDDEKQVLHDDLFSKGHPCLRGSSLTKRYGFGAHYNHEGKIAIYPMESDEYKAFSTDKNLTQLAGMNRTRSQS